MDELLADKLYKDTLISDESYRRLKQQREHPLYSLFWEIRTLLYAGIVMLTTGLGALIYKNISTIGHGAVLALIALLCTGCFTYCFRHKKPFGFAKVPIPGGYFDYILLLGTLSLLVFAGYLQYQYRVFGTHYGMATFVPALALFYIAYDFDHAGILNLAITNLGLWLGVVVTPQQLLAGGTFNSKSVIYTYAGFGLLLLAAAWLTQKESIKPHFKFSYQHYGTHVAFFALLAGYYTYNDTGYGLLWMVSLLVLAVFVFYDAYLHKNFYFLIIAILYSYLAISSLVIVSILRASNFDGLYLILLYLILSAPTLGYLLVRLNKSLKTA